MPSAEEILSDPDGIDWPSLRKSISRTQDCKRLSEILRLACPEADLPDDILPLVLRKWDCFHKRWNMESEPWGNQEVRKVICHIWVAWITGVQPRLMHLQNSFAGTYAALPEKEQALLAVQSMDDLERYPDMLKAWNKTEILLKFVVAQRSGVLYDRDDAHHISPNYVQTMVKHGYPLLLVWLVAKLYPSQLRQRETPIHYAATQSMILEVQKNSNQPVRRVIFSDTFEQAAPMELLNRATPVRLLGELCPQAGRMRDWIGELPLVSYLVHRPDSHAAPFNADDLQQLISLAPQALRTRCSREFYSGCLPYPYPFLIPTNLCCNHRWQENRVQTNKPQRIGERRYEIDHREASRRKQYEKEQLTAIYMLLRADPSTLSIAMEPPPAPAPKRKYRIGTTVVKHFPGYGWFKGRVISDDGEYYRVEYSDGDQEDLEEDELRSLRRITKQRKRARLDES